MPEIATQTDECVDVISKLNEEFDTLENQYSELENGMFKKDRILFNLLWDACEFQGLIMRNPMVPVEDILKMFCKEMETVKKQCEEKKQLLHDYIPGYSNWSDVSDMSDD